MPGLAPGQSGMSKQVVKGCKVGIWLKRVRRVNGDVLWKFERIERSRAGR
jgi:hypothetical protein